MRLRGDLDLELVVAALRSQPGVCRYARGRTGCEECHDARQRDWSLRYEGPAQLQLELVVVEGPDVLAAVPDQRDLRQRPVLRGVGHAHEHHMPGTFRVDRMHE